MPQSLAQIILHTVFSTKERRPFLRDRALREELHRYLGGILSRLDCQPIIVGGVEDPGEEREHAGVAARELVARVAREVRDCQLIGVTATAVTWRLNRIVTFDSSGRGQHDEALRYAAGNFYVNDKPTGAVVGQQPPGRHGVRVPRWRAELAARRRSAAAERPSGATPAARTGP